MASQQQQARPMFRFASMLRPAGAPPPPPAAAAAAAPQPMFRPPVAAPFRPPPPQTRDPSPPQRPPTAPPPAPAPAPPPPTAPAPPQPVAPPPVQPRFTVGAPPPAPEPRPAATIPSAPPKSPAAAIPGVQDPTRPFQLYQAPKPATSSSSSRSPPPSPKNLETNQYSPKVKPVSPLKLPPAAQFKPETEVEPRIPAEIDQKTVVVQQRSERNKATAQKLNATQRYSSSETEWTGKREAMVTKDKDNVHHKKRSDTEEPLGMSILTLAGENKGAMMELSPAAPANKHGFNGNPRRLQSEGDNSGKESDEEAKSSRVGPKGTAESLPMTAFMNSNVQGVNNSVLHNASCNHHDPGVHLIFSRKGGRYTKEAHRLKD